jgi:hypothetical protein
MRMRLGTWQAAALGRRLFDGSDKFEFCVVSVDCSRESAPSNRMRSQP